MFWKSDEKKIKEAEIEARIKELEKDKHSRWLKSVGGVDAYEFSAWPYEDYMSWSPTCTKNTLIQFKLRDGTQFQIRKWEAKALRDMLLREFPVDVPVIATPKSKKRGSK